MKSLWLYLIKTYLSIGLFFYFKRIEVHGLDRISNNKAVLIVSNHQNALLDALLIATRLNRFGHFLTRAGVFQKAFVAKLLRSFNMLPVFRIRDGWSNLTNNNSIFERVSELLHAKELVVIFPEGSHNLARRVRPLSKGFTRVVFDTYEKYPDTQLDIVPIGLNFKNAKDFVDSASVYIGEPIDAGDYIHGQRHEQVVALKKDVHDSLSKLTTHIPEESYNEILLKLNELNVDFLDPTSVNTCIESNFETCTSGKSSNDAIHKFLKGLLIISVLPPYLVWKYVAQPKIKEIEFTSTFRFAIAIVLVPIYLILLGLFLAIIFNGITALIAVISIIILELLVVKL